ncbi:uncharacterized protein PAC_19561 [Phialocephala subalpina]|uniref:Aldehyde dehydrogenase domain-containing protein n=1 Tax=Phialocephala subalpina TaxID=576137 RepID=A0A1L7XX71_9HELO|nr:uncharacterized protein PAC_19561 [Phialocephala subalpina]
MRNDQTLSPATGQLLHSFPEVSNLEAQTAFTTAHARYTTDWRLRPVSERALIISKAARIMRPQSYQLATLITPEMGKLISEAHSEVELSASILEYAWECDPDATDRGLAIEPWNFPYYRLAKVTGL